MLNYLINFNNNYIIKIKIYFNILKYKNAFIII
mgnify:CR=1 FL=1